MYTDETLLSLEFKTISSLDNLTKEQLKELAKFYVVQTTVLYKQNRDLVRKMLLCETSESFIP